MYPCNLYVYVCVGTVLLSFVPPSSPENISFPDNPLTSQQLFIVLKSGQKASGRFILIACWALSTCLLFLLVALQRNCTDMLSMTGEKNNVVWFCAKHEIFFVYKKV